MREVPTAKRLTRWMYRGKSYGTKLSAFKQLAKEKLFEEFGPVWDWARELMEDGEPMGIGDYSREQIDDASFRPWEEKFPLNAGSVPQFCKNGEPRRFDYQAYKRWLTQKAYELMKEEGV